MDIYREEILEHYTQPHHQGKINQPTHQAQATNPLCGDKINIYLKIKNNQIQDIKHQAQGCIITKATASLLCDQAAQLTPKQILKYTPQQLLKKVNTPLTASRQQCALVVLQALQDAIRHPKYKPHPKGGL
jgi:nitrogen fixation NifU-like protein